MPLLGWRRQYRDWDPAVRFWFFIEIVAGGEYPGKWYGTAWWDYNRDLAICCVIPLNLVIGRLRSWYIWARHGGYTYPDHPRDQTLYVAGVQRGIEMGERYAQTTANHSEYERGYTDGGLEAIRQESAAQRRYLDRLQENQHGQAKAEAEEARG